MPVRMRSILKIFVRVGLSEGPLKLFSDGVSIWEALTIDLTVRCDTENGNFLEWYSFLDELSPIWLHH